MQTPEKSLAVMDKDKDKADTKRLARCGKCVNCKSQVRAGCLHAASGEGPSKRSGGRCGPHLGCWPLLAICLAEDGPSGGLRPSGRPRPSDARQPSLDPPSQDLLTHLIA